MPKDETKLYICDHAGECGRKFCSHAAPHEPVWAFCETEHCYAARTEVRCIPVEGEENPAGEEE
jgi:hypothetical protein